MSEASDPELRALILRARSLSTLLSRSDLASLAGLTFDNKRDLYDALGYKRILLFSDFLSRFQRNGIARRVVTAYPDATWRVAPSVFDVDDNMRSSDFEKAWDAFSSKHDLFSLFRRVDIMVGIGRYAVIFIGGRGNIEEPLMSGSPDDVVFFRALTQGSATFGAINTDQNDPRFGMPNAYRISIPTDLSFISDLVVDTHRAALAQVHFSRIIHVAEDTLEGQLVGIPRLEPVWNDIDDLEKVKGSAAEAYWMVVNRGLHIDVDKDFEILDKSELKQEVEDYINNVQRVIRTQGVKINPLESRFHDPSGTFETIIKSISGATGIPQRVLTGSEVGQLASEMDRDNWNQRVNERRVSFAENGILRPFINRCIEIGALPQPLNGRFSVTWPDLNAFNAEQRSRIVLREGNALAAYANALAQGVKLPISEAELRRRWFDLPPDQPINPNQTVLESDSGKDNADIDQVLDVM